MNKKMKRLLSYLAILLLCSAVSAQRARGQVSEYTRDGLSFSYPSDWPLQDVSDARVQTLSLDRGENEAKILIMALREQFGPEQLAEAQVTVTQAIVNNLTRSMENQGAAVQGSSLTAMIGGAQASGRRLRAVFPDGAGSADVYWVVLNGRLVHLVFVGTDEGRARAVTVWQMVCNTLQVRAAGPPTPRVRFTEFEFSSARRRT